MLDRWLESKKGKLGARTYEEKERLIRVHLKPRIGGVWLANVNGLHVEGLLAELQASGVKPWAARHAIDVLDYALNSSVKLRLIRSNPCHSIDKPVPKKGEMMSLSAVQAKLVLEEGRDYSVYPLLAVALATGCRQGELLALGWGDVGIHDKQITVRQSLSRPKAGFVIKDPKTVAGRRTISLPGFAVDALVELKAQRLKAGQLQSPVFCTRTGNYLNKNNVLRAFRAVVKRVNKRLAKDEGAGLIPDSIRFHDLRHTHASILLSSGHSLRAVSQRLGHSNPALTLRVYAHGLPGDDGKFADGLGRMLA
jgi:integrase